MAWLLALSLTAGNLQLQPNYSSTRNLRDTYEYDQTNTYITLVLTNVIYVLVWSYVIKRQLVSYIEHDLNKKLIFVSGPRQCGKTTLSRQLSCKQVEYYNYDITADRKIILKEQWPIKPGLIIFDEIHKMKKWKSWLKGIWDGKSDVQQFLVTGSARLNWLKKSGDSLAGRFYGYRLHPFSYNEVYTVYKQDTLTELLSRGGFPEPFLAKTEREQHLWRKSHLDRIIKDDVNSLVQVSDSKQLELLVDLLAERVGGTISYANIASDLKVSPPTIKRWIELLENLYVIFTIYPYSKASYRSLKKEPKIYFYDTGRIPQENQGARLENLVATHLLKRNHYLEDTTGQSVELYYVRDKEKREVDFLTTKNKKIEHLIEVKSSDNNLSTSLKYYADKLKVNGAQLVLEHQRDRHIENVDIISVESFLKNLEA